MLRRNLLASGVAATGLLATGCDRMLSLLASMLGEGIPGSIEPPDGEAIDDHHHLLSRAGFGPWPGDVERARKMGREAWVDEQLDPERIDDAACDVRTKVIDTVQWPTSLVMEMPPAQVAEELARHALLRAVYSRQQLHEVMVELWSDHFNVAIQKSLCRHLKTEDDREVTRKHALAGFRDLVRASALSPAMLVYLDGRDNKRTSDADVPNENYARELLELHTLGVHGGYTQHDVMEVARCLTGFVVHEKWSPGRVEFAPERHDGGRKIVLGQTIEGGGAEELDRVIDLVTSHPSCHRHVATRICKTFVSDDPPAALVTSTAEVFGATRGDIRRVVRHVLLSDAFLDAKGAKVKRPFRFLVSAVRALGADTHAKGVVLSYLRTTGQPLYEHPTPDGYPIEGSAWLGTLLGRFNFAVGLARDTLDGVRSERERLEDALGGRDTSRMLRHLFGRHPTDEELRAIDDYAGPSDRKLGLALASPAFARH